MRPFTSQNCLKDMKSTNCDCRDWTGLAEEVRNYGKHVACDVCGDVLQ